MVPHSLLIDGWWLADDFEMQSFESEEKPTYCTAAIVALGLQVIIITLFVVM